MIDQRSIGRSCSYFVPRFWVELSRSKVPKLLIPAKPNFGCYYHWDQWPIPWFGTVWIVRFQHRFGEHRSLIAGIMILKYVPVPNFGTPDDERWSRFRCHLLPPATRCRCRRRAGNQIFLWCRYHRFVLDCFWNPNSGSVYYSNYVKYITLNPETYYVTEAPYISRFWVHPAFWI